MYSLSVGNKSNNVLLPLPTQNPFLTQMATFYTELKLKKNTATASSLSSEIIKQMKKKNFKPTKLSKCKRSKQNVQKENNQNIKTKHLKSDVQYYWSLNYGGKCLYQLNVPSIGLAANGKNSSLWKILI